MNPQGDRWTAETVLSLAPDAASRKAGSKLAAPGPWSGAGARPEGGGGVVWGECSGSGSKPYRTVVDLSGEGGPGFNCSCPSRKFPCKHALGLLLLWASGEAAVPVADAPPEWAEQWLERRRKRAGKAAAGPAAAGPAAPADEEASRRRGERRAERIGAGATELEQRLADLLRGGLASAEGAGYGQWDETAARMVDAQAPGLAARVRELAALPGSGADWAGRLLEECALLHTLNQGWLRLEELPEPLAATVRSRVGLTADAAALLASGAPVRDHWLVLAQRDGDDGRLVTRRIWLHGRDSGRMALLLSYGAAGRAPELSLPVGLSLDADLVYYPAAHPLRAALGTRHAPPAEGAGPPPGGGVEAALSAYGEALRDDPWLEAWPVVLDGVVPVQAPDGHWQLADAEGGSAALPVDPRIHDSTALWQLASISGGAPIKVFAEYGHRGVSPLATWTPDPLAL
ncbi:SWIM zinc finger family protein [Streptomyces telluris]|uniref:SWIM zinc finger domain-containing protein n=1 Tax=Streptomyces telluris TaxID=2720021 RepID=A0A9X2RME5_9ACTN|nr:SWIM zinc finger family protein [Streptomyces telluris]MCQ8769276.1 SWIM zinc finger domain-containing protein [Streptomyces telluris]NJP80348.1 SWIM zinc finger family protein [Streptomyces telluris]